MSVLKYYSDPDAMQIFSKITSLLGLPADFAQASQGDGVPHTHVHAPPPLGGWGGGGGG